MFLLRLAAISALSLASADVGQRPEDDSHYWLRNYKIPTYFEFLDISIKIENPDILLTKIDTYFTKKGAERLPHAEHARPSGVINAQPHLRRLWRVPRDRARKLTSRIIKKAVLIQFREEPGRVTAYGAADAERELQEKLRALTAEADRVRSKRDRFPAINALLDEQIAVLKMIDAEIKRARQHTLVRVSIYKK